MITLYKQRYTSRTMPLIKALFFSALVSIPAYILLALISGNNEPALWFICLVVFVISLLATVFIGLPTYFIFTHYKIDSPLAYINVGFIGPYLFTVWVISKSMNSLTWLVWQGTILGCFGALSAYVFWWFAVKSKRSI